MMAMISESAVDCIRGAAVGTDYSAIPNMAITSRIVSGVGAGFIFDCIPEQSVNKIAVALVAAEVGLRDETAGCIADAMSGNPDAMKLRIGRLGEHTSELDAAHLLETGLSIVFCLDDEEALGNL